VRKLCSERGRRPVLLAQRTCVGCWSGAKTTSVEVGAGGAPFSRLLRARRVVGELGVRVLAVGL
jgi:hypothetical protein